jgi:hypothetical protein
MTQNKNSNEKKKPTTPPPAKPIPTDIGQYRGSNPSGNRTVRTDNQSNKRMPQDGKRPESK